MLDINKYIDGDKLKAEIEKQMNECIGRFGEIHKLPEYRCLKNIHSYITSLQQDQPEVDLEKEWKSYMKSRKDDISGNAVTLNMKDLACHFYELGLNARSK